MQTASTEAKRSSAYGFAPSYDYEKCFRPATLEIEHLDRNQMVMWVFATPQRVGKEICRIHEVPVYGLFQTIGSPQRIWQRLPRD